jgi:hypothetical protein
MIKKSFFVIGLLLIVILSFVFVGAVDQNIPVAIDTKSASASSIAQLPDNIDLDKVSAVGANTNSFLENELVIPSYLDIPARILFGIHDGEALPFNVFMVMIALGVVLFLILKNLIKIIPFFSTSQSWFVAVIAVCLIGISGGISESSKFFFDIGNTIGVMKEYGILTLILVIVIIVVLGGVILKGTKVLKGKFDIAKAEMVGEKVGSGS